MRRATSEQVRRHPVEYSVLDPVIYEKRGRVHVEKQQVYAPQVLEIGGSRYGFFGLDMIDHNALFESGKKVHLD